MFAAPDQHEADEATTRRIETARSDVLYLEVDFAALDATIYQATLRFPVPEIKIRREPLTYGSVIYHLAEISTPSTVQGRIELRQLTADLTSIHISTTSDTAELRALLVNYVSIVTALLLSNIAQARSLAPKGMAKVMDFSQEQLDPETIKRADIQLLLRKMRAPIPQPKSKGKHGTGQELAEPGYRNSVDLWLDWRESEKRQGRIWQLKEIANKSGWSVSTVRKKSGLRKKQGK